MKAEALLDKGTDFDRVMGLMAQAALVAAAEEPGGIDHLNVYSPQARALLDDRAKMVVVYGNLPTGVEVDEDATTLVHVCARWFRANPDKYRGLAFNQKSIAEVCSSILKSSVVLGSM